MDDSAVIAGFLVKMIILALLLAVIPATIAAKKELDFVPWYFFGLFLWIVATPLAILSRPLRACPHCAEGVNSNATACPHCTRDLAEPEGRRAKGTNLVLSGI